MPSWIMLPFLPSALVVLVSVACSAEGGNLLDDPSFEQTKEKDQFGLVFAKWSGWKYEGDCDFEVGELARTGRHSCLLVGGTGAKIRVMQPRELPPGRYRVTAYLRGLDIGTGTWNWTTEFMFDDKYVQLNKNGTFGWTRLTYVAAIKERKQVGLAFGLMAPGLFWIDDVSLCRVGEDVPLTEQPVLGSEESPLAPSAPLDNSAVRCPRCNYRNPPQPQRCYACGSLLTQVPPDAERPPVTTVASFEQTNPFSGGKLVSEHATEGRQALRIDRSYVVMDRPQNWRGYDYLKLDLHSDASEPQRISVEIRDTATKDYWTRVNYETVAPPGPSTLVIPIRQLYVGEKSRPGRMLLLNAITHFVLNIGDQPPGPLFVDNIRLEQDELAKRLVFDGLYAFDLGLNTSPVMEGFTSLTESALYSPGRGYGWKDARIWRAFDVLQPDPLYQDFICVEWGGLAVDVPNGRYRVFVNLDNPSGFWGEYQVYRQRGIFSEGSRVAEDKLDFAALKEKYYRFWNVEDTPGENTFDKYQKAYYQEKTFDIEVTDGQLNINFQGENWACSVSAIIVFPLERAAEGERFLKFVEQKRRFHFDSYFKRVLHEPTDEPLRPTAEDQRRGYVGFVRDYMQEVYYNDRPSPGEAGRPLEAEAFAGEYEPLTLAVVPLQDLGEVSLAASDLSGPGGTIPATAIDVGYVSYRISRVTMQGSVYTIEPRWIIPRSAVAMPADITRRCWLTVKTPPEAKPGIYRGTLSIRPQRGQPHDWPIAFRVRAGTLDNVELPVGPFGYRIQIPWPGEEAEARADNQNMALRSLKKLRAYGFTAFTGAPVIHYRGFTDGKPVLDFSAADPVMDLARELGFTAVIGYGAGLAGLDAYYQDRAQMTAAGFTDYATFVKAVYAEAQRHADQQHWLPVYYNLGDEPIGDDLVRCAENAEAYRTAFPQGPPYFTAASSFTGSDRTDPHFRLAKAVHVADWNLHDEDSVALIRGSGSDWAFYNGGNRWTFGTYLYKAAREFDVKFRLSWHWNVVAGDPYYALDCREDDYAWCNSSPAGDLVPSIHFEQLREGLDDYRRLLTLARLAKQQPGTAAARAAEKLIGDRLAGFRLGQRDHDALFGAADWTEFRRRTDDAIESLRR